ncbi:hypothetical protein PILCRDRAFT_91078 [Piloderma croceum F 1598]|uniref:Uncharacterized protein n=1 Tax=Piloderma croceum (strain F 1598) TaxID=765440 RepID=A0A0C3BJC8_PILCF|nr:hypothetical protein PILCRDRAFT_91078 [Piloderma croceum F 1598]
MHDKGEIESAIMQHCEHSELSLEMLINLVAVYKSVVSGRNSSARCQKKLGWVKLMKNCTPTGVLDALEVNILKEQHAKYAKQTHLCSIILWWITYSAALHLPLSVLQSATTLNLLKNTQSELALYQWYTMFSHISCHEAVKDAAEEEDEFEDFQKFKDSYAAIFLNWIRLQVAHVAALESISDFAQGQQGVVIFLAVLRHPHPKPRDHSLMEPWRTTVEVALASESLHPLKYINLPKAKAVISTIAGHLT